MEFVFDAGILASFFWAMTLARAQCMIRESLQYRRSAFISGLTAAGFNVVQRIVDPSPDDCLTIWNRYSGYDEEANRFEKAGANVFVAENSYLRDLLPGKWLSLAIGDHGGHGRWPVGGNERWDDLHIELAPWRTGGKDILVLAQRGIGSPNVRSPDNWAENTQRRYGGRIRRHPSDGKVAVKPLLEDLENVACVLTWASSAALLAIAYGVPVFYGLPDWIGAPAARHMSKFGQAPLCDDAARLNMFRSLAWSIWRLEEIQSGEAFRRLLA